MFLIVNVWSRPYIITGISLYSVFLIDHAWTYEVNYARAQLKAIPGLADRMASLMGLASMSIILLSMLLTAGPLPSFKVVFRFC